MLLEKFPQIFRPYVLMSILMFLSMSISFNVAAESKRLECWFNTDTLGYDIVFDLKTKNAEISHYVDEYVFKGKYAGKVEELPSHLLFDSAIVLVRVNRETLDADYQEKRFNSTGIGWCKIKKIVQKKNKI